MVRRHVRPLPEEALAPAHPQARPVRRPRRRPGPHPLLSLLGFPIFFYFLLFKEYDDFEIQLVLFRSCWESWGFGFRTVEC